MLILIAEWGLCKGAHLPKMSGNHVQTKTLLKTFPQVLKKKCGLFTQNLDFFEMSSVLLKACFYLVEISSQLQ